MAKESAEKKTVGKKRRVRAKGERGGDKSDCAFFGWRT